MTRLQTLAAGTILAGAALAGGSASAATICFAFQDLETEFWVAGHGAITKTLQDAGHTVIERNANEDANRQLEQVRDCIAQGVDGIILIPQDGESATTIVAGGAGRRHPDRRLQPPALGPLEGHRRRRRQRHDRRARRSTSSSRRRSPAKPEGKLNAIIVVGDLGDPNAVGRKDGFYASINKHADRFNVIEVASQWDAATALANLEAAVTANPQVDLLFTSSDFLFPTIRSVFEPRGLWKKAGEDGHVWMAGLDGDATACQLIKDGFVDATGVQDLYFEAEQSLNAILAAVEAGEAQPNQVIADPGFALTTDNLGEREMDMWGCVLLSQGFLKNKS